MAFSTADITGSVFSEFGESAVLCGDHWRQTVTVVFSPNWASASADGIPIDRSEPVAQIATTGADAYGIDNTHTIEIGSSTYQITARADDGYGITLLTLAKQ